MIRSKVAPTIQRLEEAVAVLHVNGNHTSRIVALKVAPQDESEVPQNCGAAHNCKHFGMSSSDAFMHREIEFFCTPKSSILMGFSIMFWKPSIYITIH
jgi:hypothetical protein